MSIVNILMRTGILLVCGFIQIFNVLVEGLSKLFAGFVEVLDCLRDRLMAMVEKEKDEETESEPLEA